MASVRAVKSRKTGEIISHRIEVKRLIFNRETGKYEEFRWSHNREIDQRMTALQNRRAAEDAGLLAERDLDAGVHPEDRYNQMPSLVRPMTVGDWIEKVRETKVFKTAGGRRNWNSYMNLHVLPTWKTVPLDDEHVTHQRLQTWVDRLDLAPRSVATVSGTFKTVILDAVEDPTVPLSRNPYNRLRLPKPEATGRRGLSPAEVALVCANPPRPDDWPDPPEWWVIFKKTLFMTGMRIGELLSRDVEHFKPLAGLEMPQTSAVRRGRDAARTDDGGGRAPRRRTAGKTSAAVRHVMLCGSHRAELIAYVGDRTTGPLFVSARGKRPTYATGYKVVADAADAAGLPEVSPHIGRYTAKSVLADAGVHKRAIDYQIGHETQGMDRYITPTPAMLAAIPAALEAFWCEAFGSATTDAKAAR